MVFYQVCSNEVPRVQDGQEILGSNHRNIFKNFLLQNHLAQMLEIWYVACLVVFYQVCSNEGPRVQDSPGPGGPGFDWLRCLKLGM